MLQEAESNTESIIRKRRNSMSAPPDLSDLKIVLLGKVGAGKSASGNTIIGGDRDTFETGFLPGSNSPICQSAHTKVNGQKIHVTDTIGFSDPPKTDKETQNNKLEQIFDCARDGVDVFLLVIKLGEKYTETPQETMKWTWIQEIFGAKALKHTIVLFTHRDLLDEPVEECLSKSEILRSVVDQCAGRYHVFNNKSEDPSQVTDFLRKTESLRKMNRYNRYTKQDYEKNQKELLDEECRRREAAKQERLLKEAAEKEKILKEAADREKKEAEERERLLKEAAEREKKEAEERERLLKEAAEREKKEAKERERLLKEAAERERLLKEAAEREKKEAAERERLLKEAAEREKKEAEERERLLKEAADREKKEAEERERLLKEAEERERLLKEAAEREGLLLFGGLLTAATGLLLALASRLN